MTLNVRFLLPAAMAVAVACATAGQGSSTSRDSRRITRDELDQLHEMGVRNLYEAIDRIRPRWLVVRSGPRSFGSETEVAVFQDALYLGNTDALQRMGLEGVYEIRYLDGSTAQATLSGIGDRLVQGAIVVYMSPPPGSGG
jgi:hypothetical protein